MSYPADFQPKWQPEKVISPGPSPIWYLFDIYADALAKTAESEAFRAVTDPGPLPFCRSLLKWEDGFTTPRVNHMPRVVKFLGVQGRNTKNDPVGPIVPALLWTAGDAMIEAVEQNVKDQVHFALVVEEDPGRDHGLLRQSGHRFFYSTDEVEPLLPPT